MIKKGDIFTAWRQGKDTINVLAIDNWFEVDGDGYVKVVDADGQTHMIENHEIGDVVFNMILK